jgi:voltage-gated potassium channel
MTEFLTFMRFFAHAAWTVRGVLIALLLLLLSGAMVISKVEQLHFGQSVYFAFITALSVGYGDIVASTVAGKVASVAIGLVGMVFVGLTVAISNLAVKKAVEARTGDQE